MKKTRFVFCYHAERADRNLGKESKNFPGITEKGEKETREKTETLAKMVRSLSDNSVVILGGCSKAIRTASTLAVFTDELRQVFTADEKILFSTQFNSATPLLDTLREISERIRSNRAADKVIVDFPLKVEEFISWPGQKEPAIARRILAGLDRQVRFFRKFFPRNPMVLVNVGHAPETDAFINFLHKRSGDEIANIVSFM
ncbi:MAG: hypothetical protein NTV77_03265 [Candidatus Azambacteria bacterium]|nr:hypothetical protein [Candidatus Azambacteria bacterium]